jgi:hypothetical protein
MTHIDFAVLSADCGEQIYRVRPATGQREGGRRWEVATRPAITRWPDLWMHPFCGTKKECLEYAQKAQSRGAEGSKPRPHHLQAKEDSSMSIHTPWGMSDSCSPIADGITFYGTPGHGGLLVSTECVAKMHPALARISGHGSQCGGRWFEEDCEFAAVAAAFPEEFEAKGYKRETAHQSLKEWHPDEYCEAFGPFPAEESGVLRRRRFRAMHKNDLGVVSAIGIDGGLVRCHAVKGGRMQNGSYPPGEPVRIFLVPKREYDTRSPDGHFIIDPERHLEEKEEASAGA